MGFNPRLHPYTIAKSFHIHVTSKDAAARHNIGVFKFPFAGQLVGAAANAVLIGAAGAHDLGVEATTVTGIQEISFWKHATDDTTATFATGLRALQRTGAKDTSSATVGGINWRLVGDSGVPQGLYTFSDNNTAAASRKQFNAGDGVLLSVLPYGATDAHRTYRIEYQLDYIIGRES